MKTFLSLFIILVLSNDVQCQKTNQNEMVGKWKVVKILGHPADPTFIPLTKSFSSAVFYFESNSEFKLTTSENSPIFSIFTDQFQDSQWKMKKNDIVINKVSGDYEASIMKIMVTEVNGATIFHLSETGFTMEVQKE